MKKEIIMIPLIVFTILLFSGIESYAKQIPGEYFYIQSAQEYGRGLKKGFWDVPGKPRRFKKGMNIQVWDMPSDDRYSSDRAFAFRHVRGNIYEIWSRMHPNSRIDVAGGKRRNGTNILLWKRHGGKNQQFRMIYRGGGRWKIYPLIGGVVCLKGRSSKNGSNVHIWNDHRGPWTEWVLIKRGYTRAFIPQRSYVKRTPQRRMSNNLTLRAACNPRTKYLTASYFSRVPAQRFSRENRRESMSTMLNMVSDSNRAVLAKEIVKATSNNPNAASRLYIYSELNRAKIFRDSNFLVQLMIKQIRDEVRKSYIKEKNIAVRNVLRQMKQKF